MRNNVIKNYNILTRLEKVDVGRIPLAEDFELRTKGQSFRINGGLILHTRY